MDKEFELFKIMLTETLRRGGAIDYDEVAEQAQMALQAYHDSD